MLHYIRSIEKTDPKEKQYFEDHEKRFYETLRLVSKVLTPESKVLDIGSYPAVMPALIRKYIGPSVSCCGLKKESLKVFNPEYGDEFYFHVDACNVEEEALPYADASFDFVLCCEVLEHMARDPMFMASEINRVLKWNGLLLLTTPNLACLRSVKGVLEAWHPYLMSEYVIGSPDRHCREYTVHEVRHLLECGGFEVVSLDTKDVWNGFDPSVIEMLKKLGKSTDFRGDDTFALMRKKSLIIERYPDKFYVR